MIRGRASESADPGVIRIALELSDEDVRRIAERTAELIRAESRGAALESPYMTVEEAAAYLRCRRQRIDDLLCQRRLARIKDGSRTLIARAELEDYLGRASEGSSAAMRRAA